LTKQLLASKLHSKIFFASDCFRRLAMYLEFV